jgi:hypothetical protein
MQARGPQQIVQAHRPSRDLLRSQLGARTSEIIGAPWTGEALQLSVDLMRRLPPRGQEDQSDDARPNVMFEQQGSAAETGTGNLCSAAR